jgi:hypothetical protein
MLSVESTFAGLFFFQDYIWGCEIAGKKSTMYRLTLPIENLNKNEQKEIAKIRDLLL